jgi:uncharacterized Zn finger protein
VLPSRPIDLMRPFRGQGEGQVTIIETEIRTATQVSVRSNCPDCNAGLTVLRVIPGRAGSEYWTLRCIRCGGIHLDIVKSGAAP